MFTDELYPKEVKLVLYHNAQLKAFDDHGTSAIHPCGAKEFDECFTDMDDHILFWYNVDIGTGQTTCVIKQHIPN